METVVLNRFESKMWVNRIVLNSLQCNRIIDCGKLWEFAQQNNFYVIRESSRCGAMDTAADFSNCGQNRLFWPQFCQLIIFDFSQLFCYNWFKYPGVAQLVAHLVWDQGVERSNRSTRTKKAVDFRIDGFFASLWDVKGFLLDWL